MRRSVMVLLAVGLPVLVVVVTAAFASPDRQVTALKKGGTLRVDVRTDFDHIDPAVVLTSTSWQANFLTQANLLNLRDKEGAAGMKIVPEVAVSLPKVSNRGKTYTFKLKKTYKFSDGRAVTAANFKLEFERVASPALNSPGAAFIRDIVGAEAMIAGKARHISGIQVHGKYKLSFKLTKVAPDFVARMTMPFFAAVPSNMPFREVGPPLPSAGPYYHASWERNRAVVLNRNKFYFGPRPNNPDQIVYNLGIGLDAQRLRCERGDSDVCSFPPAQAAELRGKYGLNAGRYFVKGQPILWYLTFNHDQPLFKGNDKLKQAVNHAIDRPQIVAQVDNVLGADAATATDQLLPGDFPGFRDWAIYSLKRAEVAKAKELAAGNTRSGKARLWTFNSSFGPAVAQVVQFNLKQMGLDTEITALDRVVQTTRGRTRGAEYDMFLNVWDADYPDPYDFLNILLEGKSIRPDNNLNLSYFNESAWNAKMDRAGRQSGAARYRAYSLLDRDLMTGPAPVVPLFTQNARILVSDRVTNYIFHKVYGSDFAAISLN